ncbi:hypothetical protein NQZ68_034776 [Dissostichus eleginoides]|nr:hypothetical protein NQZ68_034776 [Dissostichus eleginoides]
MGVLVCVRGREKEPLKNQRSRGVCIGPSCSVRLQVTRPPAPITQRLMELTFRRALPTPGLPVLCQPLTKPRVSHRQGRSENRARESTQAEVELRTPFSISLGLSK